MHELSLVFSIIKTLERVCKENDVEEVSKVVLELGEVSLVVPKYLEDAWVWARVKKSQHLKKAELEIQTIKAVTFCEDCKKEYETVKYGKICPFCKSQKTYLVKGSEINIKEIVAR